jgi:hypothetical protein
MMNRIYEAKVEGCAPVTLLMSYSQGPFDAAKKLQESELPDFQLIPGGRIYPPEYDGSHHKIFRFELINHEKQIGQTIWIKELM